MNTLASGRPLGYGEYKDCARPLRRQLKQYGSGSLEGGLRFAQTNGDALAELVALLNVDRPVRARWTLGCVQATDFRGFFLESLDGTGISYTCLDGTGTRFSPNKESY